MSNRDRQHYISQAYLRLFSSDFDQYMKGKDSLPPRQKVTRKRKMRIYCYDLKRQTILIRRIQRVAFEDHYLPKAVDREIQNVERKIPLLYDIVAHETAPLQDKDNIQSVREIVNCFWSRSRTFRDMIEELEVEDFHSESKQRQNKI